MHRVAISAVWFFCLLLVSFAFAIHKADDSSNRIADKLSDEPHSLNGEHNADYDHEAFLGSDEAKTFDQLTPEESRDRLSKIVDQVDKDADGLVTLDELKDWIRYTQRRYVVKDAEKQWGYNNPDKKDSISWDDYKNIAYGFLEGLNEQSLEETEHIHSYKNMLRRDERRWAMADEDKDGRLTKEEFTNFLHPEDVKHMQDVVVIETMEDIDKNSDGEVSLDEYIGDMYKADEGEEEPEWVATEREQFGAYRDQNKDGVMDRQELRNWIIPPEYDHAEAEAKHLIYESDTNEDSKLTKDEILEKYDLFVGSQATDFGEALTRHDEF